MRLLVLVVSIGVYRDAAVFAASPPSCPAIIGSAWFTSEEGQAMADMVAVGLLDLSPPE
jgi:hypothetical protein